jgi:ParB family chromosome partitioning protein
MQAITVRKDGSGNSGYIIVAGERRWRASKLAGCDRIKARVIQGTERQIRLLSIVENLHRKDLNPVEESDAFDALMRSEELDESGLAKTVGKSLRYIRDSLRLQALSAPMREALIHAAITLPQALHLSKISHGNQMAAFKKVDKMNSKEWGRMVEAMAEHESQAEMFAIDPEEQKQRRELMTKYDAMIERVEALVCKSFKRDEVSILASVLDGSTELRAARIDMIVKHLLLVRDALKRAKASQQSRELIAN